MPFISKIARLPQAVRHELGFRLEDGHSGAQIILWLNQQPDVPEILKIHFDGRPITEQNLSDWKQSGHREWLRRQAAEEAAIRITEHADALEPESDDDRTLADCFAAVLTSELTRLAMLLFEKEEDDPDKQWKRLCSIRKQLSALRRDESRDVRTAIELERWERKVERQDEKEKECQEEKQRERLVKTAMAPWDTDLLAMTLGRGQFAHHVAELITHIKLGLPHEHLLEKIKSLEPAQPARNRAAKPKKSGDIASYRDSN